MAYEGSQYQATRGETCAQLAKRMRAEIKKLSLPAGATVRVTSGSSKIDIDVQGMTDAQVWLPQDADDIACFRRKEHTPEAQKLADALNKIRNAYQRDDSDIQADHFDTRYYGHVSFEDEQHAGWRAGWDAEKVERAAQLKAEKAAAQAAPYRAAMTDGGIGVYAKADGRRVTLIKLRPYQLRAGVKHSEIEYYLGMFNYNVVRYDRTKRAFDVTRKVAAS